MPEPTEKVWIITPHDQSDYDECWLRARDDGENYEDEQAALRYAKQRLEGLWDQIECGEGPIAVTIELREVVSSWTPWGTEDADV